MGIKALKGRKQYQIKGNAFALSGLVPSFRVTQGDALCYCFRPFRAEKNCTFCVQTYEVWHILLNYFDVFALQKENLNHFLKQTISPMQKLTHLIVLVIFFQVSILSSICSQISTNQIDELVGNAIAKLNVAGAAVAIVKDGKVIHSKGYGVISTKTKEKVDKHTRFAIASNSKAFTAAALAILVDEGKLKWEDKVVDYVPEFKMYAPYVTANFMIVDLLTHRSGLGLGAGDLMFFPDGGDYTMDDILKSFQYQKKVSEFRTQFDYDNLLYVVAGEIIERISGKSWSEFVENKIMKPIGMNHSAGTYNRLSNKKNVATPHATKEGKLIPLEVFDINLGASAGGIYASVEDLTKWMLLQLNEGQQGDKVIFSKKNHKKMWKPYTNMGFSFDPNPRYKTHFSAYGLGWGIRDMNGYVVFSHTGGLPGMLSKTTIIPELNLGIIVLTNTDPGGAALFSAVTNTVVDDYLGLEKEDWTGKYVARMKGRKEKGDEVTQKVWEVVKSADASSFKEGDYIGVYEDNWFGKVKIFKNNEGKLWLKSLRSPKLNGEMFFYKANTFVVKWEYQDMNADAFVMFSLDEEGKAQSIKMKGISPNIDFSFDFHDLDLQRVEH